MVEAKKHNAVCHFLPDSLQLHELFLRFHPVRPDKAIQFQFPCGYCLGCNEYVLGSVAAAEHGKVFRSQPKKLLWGGEGIEYPAVKLKPFPVAFAKALNYALYALYVVALRNDEGAESFPGLLSEYADTHAVLCAALMLLGLLLCPALLTLINTPLSIMADCRLYLNIYFLLVYCLSLLLILEIYPYKFLS